MSDALSIFDSRPVEREGGLIQRVASGITGSDWFNHWRRKKMEEGMNAVGEWVEDGGLLRAGKRFNDWVANEPGLEDPVFTPKRERPAISNREWWPSNGTDKGVFGGRSLLSSVPQFNGVYSNGNVRKKMFRKRGLRRRHGRRRSFKRRGGRRGGSKAVTFQHDQVSTYRGKRRNGRRKVRFFKRALSVVSQGLPTYQIRRTNATQVTGTAGTQGITALPGLYTLYGSANWDDMAQINALYGKADTAGSADTVFVGTRPAATAGKIAFSRAYFEMDLTNSAATPCVVEIYKCCSRVQGRGTADPTVDFTISDYRPSGTTAMTGSIANGQPQYLSPFDSANFTSKWKVLNCKKIYLDPGKSTDYSFGSGRKVYFTGSNLADVAANAQCQFEGHTVFLLVIVTGAPVSDGGSGAQFSASSCMVTMERRYSFKVLPGGNRSVAVI